MVPVYKRLDTIEHPSIANPYQPPPGAAKWVNYKEEEVNPQHVASKLEYADLDLQDIAANQEADHLGNIKHANHILEVGQCEQLKLAE